MIELAQQVHTPDNPVTAIFGLCPHGEAHGVGTSEARLIHSEDECVVRSDGRRFTL